MREYVPKCNRCGSCCHYWKNNEIKKCKYLIKLKDNKTLCRIYNNRLGRLIDVVKGKKIFCNRRIDVKKHFKGCPYNRYTSIK